MTYEPMPPIGRDEAVALLDSGEPEKIIRGLVRSAYHDKDWRWVQWQCIRFLGHEDVWVRRNSAHCLGLMAITRKGVDPELVLPILKELADDPDIGEEARSSIGYILGAMEE